MTPAPLPGSYSLVQFCPDPARAEGVNLGVVLCCPARQFVKALLSRGNHRAARLVGRDALDVTSLQAAKRALEERLTSDAEQLATLEGFRQFATTRGNALQLTEPRPVRVFEPELDLQTLYADLVGGATRGARVNTPLLPQLETRMARLAAEGKAEINLRVPVPLSEQTLRVRYALPGEVTLLIKPQRFPADEAPALKLAAMLAIDGDQLSRHEVPGRGRSRLVVVPVFDRGAPSEYLLRRISGLLTAYGVEVVPEGEVEQFLRERVREEPLSG
ncbi:MAG: DUF3037 domain-containing protein [Planctomycetaceae bacterium]|jgi:hypothetical protein